MTNETNLRNQIIEFYMSNPDTPMTAASVADKFGFGQELSQSEKGDVVRSLKKTALRKIKHEWIPKSKWEVPVKGGGTVVLQSWKTSESDFTSKFRAMKEGLLEGLSTMDKAFLQDVNYEPGECLAELNIFDYHFGKADGRSLDEQCSDFLSAVKVLKEKVKGFQVDKYLFVLGNDLFNVDTAHNTTTKGTSVAGNAEWDEVYSKGVKVILQSIHYLLRFAPVDIVIVQGNHDYLLSFTLGELLKHYFSNEKNVTVFNDVGESRKYYKYGKCLIGYTHGNQEKQQELPLIMAVEKPKEFATCIHRYWRVGHLHHSIVKDYQGVEVETLGSLSKPDRWHKVNGYLSKPKAQVTIFNKEAGKEGQFIFNNY